MIEPEHTIKEFWEARARDRSLPGESVTHSDLWQRWLEIEMIKDHLGPTDRVLEVGCGNGHTTRQIAGHVAEIVAVDFAEEMINRARSVELDESITDKIRFSVLDVLELNSAAAGTFDTVISERCLINLPDWKSQQQALDNIASVIAPRGKFIFLEGSQQGRRQLNEARRAAGLDKMPNVWHNVDFDEDLTLAHLEQQFTVEHRGHCGVYDFLARVVHPLLVAPDAPQYDATINKIGAELARQHDQFAHLSRVLFLVLRKRA
jgi:ubiquinone/menaquinone biosynthesis C-methylase UbiE